MTGDAWDCSDVPGLAPQPKPPNPRRRRGPGGGRKHPVTLGHFDAMIVQMAQRDERIVHIAGEIGCGEGVITRRLRVLGIEYQR